ncbi:MBL fold metallo-hydrolase [Halorutilales archaeon Cl-col2-1]
MRIEDGVERIPTPSTSSNVYSVDGVLVDVGTDLSALPDSDEVYITHAHADHVGCLPEYVDETDAEFYIHPKAWDTLAEDDEYARLNPCFVNDGDTVYFGEYAFEVLHTPGHSPGSVSYYSEDEKTLFAGDVVFGNGSPGRTDMPGGDSEQLRRSLERLKTLEVEYLYPGHSDPSHTDVEGKIHVAASLV